MTRARSATDHHGSAANAALRAAGRARSLHGTVITARGTDEATCSTLFRRPSAPGVVGRQMQTWIRARDGWRVVAADVSVIPGPGA